VKVNFLIIIVLVFVIFSACNNNENTNTKSEDKDSVIVIPPTLLYGYNVDSFHIINDKIKKNESLSDIFGNYNIPYDVLNFVANLPDSIFNVRHLRVSYPYTILCKNDSAKTPQLFIYENNKIDFTVIDFRDSIIIKNQKKEIITTRNIANGEVTSSLWNAMVDSGYDPMLAIEMSEIYAWTIDFFGLQKGDKFKIIYNQQFVDTIKVGISDITAVSFTHANNEFIAIYFQQDTIVGYFDEEGNSLRKAFLKAPLKFSRISSKFSNSRFHPVLKIRRPHHGVDYAAPTGTPVYTIGDGTVIKKGWGGGGGNAVKVKHNSVYTTVYMHLSKFGDINVGDFITQSTVVGYVGSTGLATGPHLDFRVYMNGKAIDPLKMESPPVEPIDSTTQENFDIVKAKVLKELLDI